MNESRKQYRQDMSYQEQQKPDLPARAGNGRPGWLPGLVLLGFLIMTGIMLSLWGYYCIRIAGQQPQNRGLDEHLSVQITERGSQLIAQPCETWPSLLSSGRANAADYLMRLFLSPRYLATAADDRQFIQDLHHILAGEALAAEALDQEAAVLMAAEGRLQYINKVLEKQNLGGALSLARNPTRLRTLQLAGDQPRDGQEVVGRFPVDTLARLTGSDAVFRLYAGDQLVDEVKARASEQAGEEAYQLSWQTDLSGSGVHDLAVLVLCSDGRGQWLDVASLHVPEVVDLPAGSVHLLQETGWFRVAPWSDGTVRLNIVAANKPLAAELYTEDHRILARTDSMPGQPGALLARPEQEGPYYVRLGHPEEGGLDTTASAQYTLVCAPAAAPDPEHHEQWLAVLEEKESMVQTQDLAGRIRAIPAEQLQILDPEARLSALLLRLPNGETADLAPVFSPNTQRYALCLTAEMASVGLQYTAMEGSSATMTAGQSVAGAEQQPVINPNAIVLSSAINQLSVTVRGFSGLERTYDLFVLRPPDSAGLSTMLNPFPLDYRSPLLLLHLDYPAYQFEAQQTGIDWLDFLDAQDETDRNLIAADHVPETWVEEGSPVYDGSSWKAAARQVIAHYADPRNFLDPVNVFQFEKLTYLPELHTRHGVEQILKGSFMESGRSDLDYAALILEAGQDADISPFFLAARIIQEMGREGQSPLSSGSLTGYSGVFNFYNIGSTPNPEVPDGALINGARYALYGRNPDQGEITPDEAAWLLPWTSPRRAIIGGARWIAERYVAIGQDTLYGQKFDLIAEDGLFIRQYAQNIQMAWAEGRRTRQAWQDLGLLQEAFVFRIPVFDQMPPEPAALP